MGYTATVTFADGNNLDGDDIKTNQKQARDFWNEGIRTADINNASVSSQELQKGDFRSMTNDYSFLSGEVATNTRTQASSYNDINNVYYTAHIKNESFLTRILERTIIPNTGKTFVMEKAGEAIIDICLDINIPNENYYREGLASTAQSFYPNFTDPAAQPHLKEDRVYLYVDGAEQPHSSTPCFPEGALEGTTPAPPSALMAVAANIGSSFKPNKREVMLTVLVKGLAAGTHSYDIRINANSEVAYVGAISTSIETFYLD
jgi:hypothetical protein